VDLCCAPPSKPLIQRKVLSRAGVMIRNDPAARGPVVDGPAMHRAVAQMPPQDLPGPLSMSPSPNHTRRGYPNRSVSTTDAG
jgi:hypothetical protein